MTAIGGRGGEGGHRQGFQRLWAPLDDNLLQIPEKGDLCIRQQLANGGKELVPGKGGFEEDDTNPQQRGGGAAGVWFLFYCCGAGGATLRIGYLGGHTQNDQDTMGVSGPGGDTDDGADKAEDTRQEVDVNLGGNGKGGYRVLDYGGLHPAAPEHGCTVHPSTITVRPV